MIFSLNMVTNVPTVLRTVNTHLINTGYSVDRLKSKFTSLGNFGISRLANGVTNLLSQVNRLAISAAGSFLTVNSNLEQMQIMMTTATGSLEGGNKALNDMLTVSTKVPFNIDALSDSFVKLKVSGLDPMDGTLMTLTDSLAAFGGNSEQLKLITVAIQQMVGKGVISMEELRRQFGEQVPTAIRAMAEGLGISMGEMFDRMKKGQLGAMEGIDAMLGKLNEWHGGASEARMKSFSGAITLVRVEWTKLMKFIGDSDGLFSKITKSVNVVSESLRNLYTSAEGQEKLQAISEEISIFFQKIVENPGVIKDFFDNVVNAAEVAVAPIKRVYDMLVWIQASADQISGDIKKSSLEDFGVDTGKLNADNWYKVRDALKEVTELRKGYYKFDMKSLLPSEGGKDIAQWVMSMFTGKDMKEVEDRVEKLVYEINEKLNNDIAPITLTADRGKIKKTAEDIEVEMTKMKKSLNTSLESVDETFTSKLISNAESMISSYGKASNLIVDELSRITDELDKQKDKLAEMKEGFADDLRDTAREGMSDEGAWKDQISQIEEYKAKAATAFKSGNIEEYVGYLEKALRLTKALSTSGIEEPFDENKLKRAREEFERINKATRGNKVAGGEKMYTDALDNLNKLLKEQKEGSSIAVTAQEQLNVKIKLQKELQEAIEKSQVDKIKSLEDERKNYENIQDNVEKLSGMMDVYKKSIENGTIAVSEFEGKWSTSTSSILQNISKITSAIEDMIAKSKDLKIGGGEVTGVDGFNARGGDIKAGGTYVVGEEGPEIFRPSTNGTIIPNHAINKSQDEVSISIKLGTEKVEVRGSRFSASKLKYMLEEEERYRS